MEAEGAIDVAVVMSRWFGRISYTLLSLERFSRMMLAGGTMLGPVRFSHFETVTTGAIKALQTAEELISIKSKLMDLDESINAAILKLPNRPSPGKTPDYSDLDVVKGNRLILARTKRLEALQKNSQKKEQVEKEIANMLPPIPEPSTSTVAEQAVVKSDADAFDLGVSVSSFRI